MTGRDTKLHSSASLPDSVTNDATGRLTLLLGAKRSRAGALPALAFLAGSVTARDRVGG